MPQPQKRISPRFLGRIAMGNLNHYFSRGEIDRAKDTASRVLARIKNKVNL